MPHYNKSFGNTLRGSEQYQTDFPKPKNGIKKIKSMAAYISQCSNFQNPEKKVINIFWGNKNL